MAAEKPLKWKDLDGAQKYKVVELAKKPETSVTDLCRTFGVSRQTLYRAMDLTDKAATAALTAKRKGRPPIPVMEKDLQVLHVRNKQLESDLKQEKLKNQVAQALLDLHRKAERQQRLLSGKKTGRKQGHASTGGSDGSGS